jgi:transcriptional regulator GlxA family with amidase domain
VELKPVRDLIERSVTGLSFAPETGLSLLTDYEAIFDQPPMQRLLGLVSILARLSEDTTAQPLSSVSPRPIDASRSRLDRVLTHLHQHYAEPVALPELAEIAALSVSGLHRLFTKHTRTSISAYLTGLRIGDACSRLSSTDAPIQHIADAVGYASLANFNRQFRTLRGMTPREYRGRFR